MSYEEPPGRSATASVSSEAWLRFGVKTAGLARLDPASYPSVPFSDGAKDPKPDWVCQSPSTGGWHVHAAARRIDVHIAEPPLPRVELNAIAGYDLTLIMTSWLDLISDLINPGRVFVGDVILKGEILPDWRTIRSLAQPLLRATKETLYAECPRCGDRTVFPVSGPLFFEDTQIAGEPVIATNAIFVREDLALARNLRRPHGSFKPERVVLKRAVAAKKA
jgi:hypothetical protein